MHAVEVVAAFVLAIAGAPQDPGETPDAWRRLRGAFARRTTEGGLVLGLEEPDPLLWPTSDHLLEPERHAELMAAIDAFVSADEASRLDDPLRRVLLQHDLWAVFDWAVAATVEEDAGRSARRDELGRALARALACSAPTADEIDGLPDNLARAAADGLPAEPDPAHPRAPFLPGDLARRGGPWVLLGDVTAPQTPLAAVHADVFGGRSLFEVRLRLPGAREDALRYLELLREHPAPTVACDGSRCHGFDPRMGRWHAHLNPDLPEPPAGSMVALVRRLLAFDDRGELHATPVVKNVQLRAFLPAPEDTPSAGLPLPEGWPWQAVAELHLDREALLAGGGGLAPILPGQHAFAFLGAHGDEVELHGDFDPRRTGPRDAGRLASCGACHGVAGILSVNSYTGIATGPRTHLHVPLRGPPRRLDVQDFQALAERALRFKRARFDWGVLWARLVDEDG